MKFKCQWKDTHHGKRPLRHYQGFAQIHQAAALGVDRASGFAKRADFLAQFCVLREFVQVQLRVAAGQHDRIRRGDGVAVLEVDLRGAGVGPDHLDRRHAVLRRTEPQPDGRIRLDAAGGLEHAHDVGEGPHELCGLVVGRPAAGRRT